MPRFARIWLVVSLLAAAVTGSMVVSYAQASIEGTQKTLPQFTFLVWESKAEIDRRAKAGGDPDYWGAYKVYSEQLQAEGMMLGGSAVEPPLSGRMVRTVAGRVQAAAPKLQDGEMRLGGYFIVQAKDLETAVAWAGKCPAALTGAVEVRPNVVMPAP
ncbi:MAG: YciI family protein [Planctomycetaceae bacterium]|nr:YciI family protein [Planctomycetaceae bacterium]